MQILSSKKKKIDGENLLDELIHYKLTAECLMIETVNRALNYEPVKAGYFQALTEHLKKYYNEHKSKEYAHYENIIKTFFKNSKPQ